MVIHGKLGLKMKRREDGTLSTTAVEMEGVLKMEIERENRTKGTSRRERDVENLTAIFDCRNKKRNREFSRSFTI